MSKKKRFSPKTNGDLPKLTIIRDTREKLGCGWKFNATANCNGTVEKKLETGDYSIEGMEHLIMIERKTIADLWGTLTSQKERFIAEMERALAIPSRYLIIEGTMRDIFQGCYFSRVTPEYILSSLTTLEQKYNLHVIYVDKRKDICQRYVRRLLEKLYKLHAEALQNGRPVDSIGPTTSD